MSHLTLDHIKEVETQVLSICNEEKTLPDIIEASNHLWNWVSQITELSIDKLRAEIETHETDEHFPNPFAEERDHLLKLPIVLLEILHKKA